MLDQLPEYVFYDIVLHICRSRNIRDVSKLFQLNRAIHQMMKKMFPKAKFKLEKYFTREDYAELDTYYVAHPGKTNPVAGDNSVSCNKYKLSTPFGVFKLRPFLPNMIYTVIQITCTSGANMGKVYRFRRMHNVIMTNDPTCVLRRYLWYIFIRPFVPHANVDYTESSDLIK